MGYICKKICRQEVLKFVESGYTDAVTRLDGGVCLEPCSSVNKSSCLRLQQEPSLLLSMSTTMNLSIWKEGWILIVVKLNERKQSWFDSGLLGKLFTTICSLSVIWSRQINSALLLEHIWHEYFTTTILSGTSP